MKRALVMVAAVGWMAGCGGGSGTTAQAPPPPPPAAAVDFTAFTKSLLANQSDTAMPLPISPTEFVFNDDDNPAAFASVLPGP